MAKDIKLSVALATYNEEDNIVACLESVNDLADEIVVVDGSSIDNTRKLAKDLGAKVIKTTNKPIFHINKNIAIDESRGEWILQLDADEIIPSDLADEIKRLISTDYLGYTGWKAKQEYPKDKQKPVAYWIKRKNYFLGRVLKKSGQYPDPVIRLLKKGKARLPAKDVHEQMEVDGPTAWLKHDMDHLATPTFSRYLQRENRYSSLTAQFLKERSQKVNFLSFLNFMIIKPTSTFLSMYLRHRGFKDGFPGFVFCLFSGIHHQLSFLKLWELKKQSRDIDLKKDWN